MGKILFVVANSTQFSLKNPDNSGYQNNACNADQEPFHLETEYLIILSFHNSLNFLFSRQPLQEWFNQAFFNILRWLNRFLVMFPVQNVPDPTEPVIRSPISFGGSSHLLFHLIEILFGSPFWPIGKVNTSKENEGGQYKKLCIFNTLHRFTTFDST